MSTYTPSHQTFEDVIQDTLYNDILHPKDPNQPIFESPFNYSWIDENGIYCSLPKLHIKPTSTEDIQGFIEAYKRFAGDKKRPFLTMVNPALRISRSHQKHYQNFIEKRVTKMALITTSPLSKFIVHYYSKIYPQEFPLKAFTKTQKAKYWLLN